MGFAVLVAGPGGGTHGYAEVVLNEDVAVCWDGLVIGCEEDDGAGEFWDGGEGGPPLSDEVGTIGVPMGGRERVWRGEGDG
jgi:hypothetical protein